MIHKLKCWPVFFQAVIEGRKPFEVRSRVDRKFRYGDSLLLQEWDPQRFHPRPNDQEANNQAILNAYTGREVVVYITYILSDDITYKGEPAAILGIQLPRELKAE